MSNSILIYFNGTFVNRQNGAHSRVADLIRFSTSFGRQVIVYSYYEHPTCPWRPEDIKRFHVDNPGVELVLDHRSRLFSVITKLKMRLIALMPHLAPRLLSLKMRGLTPEYNRIQVKHPEIKMIINYAHGLVELNGVNAARAIIETHDINFLNATKSLKRALTSVKTILSARMEFELLGRSAALIAIAPPEAAIFRLFYPGKSVLFVPVYQLPSAKTAAEAARFDILFVGSENALNVDGLCSFITEHRNWLANKSMAIVGRVCNVDQVREVVADLPNIEMLGYVDDLTDLMRHCRLLVSPVDGTGLKIKALEALAVGLPVFGSRGTLDGLPDGYEHCAFPIDTTIIDRFIADEGKQNYSREAARRYSRQLLDMGDLDRLKTLLIS